jgi:hypothetical protein
MPYIEESKREMVDGCISELVLCMKSTLLTAENINVFNLDKLDNKDILESAGVMNYCFTRIINKMMGEISYPKIAIMTGILENIKQEFYRRAAAPYEDRKISQNGDVKEYKKI